MRRLGGIAAILGGVTWAVVVPLIAAQATESPVGARYDEANRLLTVALVLLPAAAYAVWRAAEERHGRAPLGLASVVAGLGLMLAGNLLEFWGALLAGEPVSAEADRTGETAWRASDAGFTIFALGGLVATGGALAASIRLRSTVLVAVAAAAMLVGTFLWPASVVAALVASVVAGGAWAALGARLLSRPRGPWRT